MGGDLRQAISGEQVSLTLSFAHSASRSQNNVLVLCLRCPCTTKCLATSAPQPLSGNPPHTDAPDPRDHLKVLMTFGMLCLPGLCRVSEVCEVLGWPEKVGEGQG